MFWINDFLHAFGKAVTSSGQSAWFPFDSYRLYPLFADLDVRRWDQVAKAIKRKGFQLEKLIEVFAGAGSIRVEAHFALHAIKFANLWETEAGQQVARFFGQLMQLRCYKDDWYGKNKAGIHAPEKVEQIVQQTPWHTVSLNEHRVVGNLFMAALHTAYAYYADYCFCQWYNLIGPYELADGRVLLIRRFSNFHPTEIWQGPFPKFKSMDIFTVYKKGAAITVDQWSHIESNTNLAQRLEFAALLVDGTWTQPKNWNRYVEELATVSTQIQNQWRALDFEQTKRKVLELRWYQFRDLFNILGLDWRPTREMYGRIKNRPLLPDSTPEFKSVNEAKQWWMQFADPRTQEGLADSYREAWKK